MMIKTPWTTQPQQACEIDLKLGPSAAWNFATKRDAVSGLEMVLGADNSSGVWRDGRYINVTGASNLNRVECVSSVSAIAPGAGDFTVTVTFVFDGLTGGYSAFGRWNTGATPSTSDWFLGAGSTFGVATADFTVACGSSVYSASAAGAWVVGNKYTFIGRRRGTTIYVDRYNHTTGVWVSGSTTNAGITTINYNAARKTKLGEIDIGAGYNIAATYSTAATFKRCLSGAEVRSLSANPWQIFKPLPRRIFAPVATSSDILGTLSVTEGTETLSASGTVTGATSVDGSANLTESAETVTASGTVLVSGSSSTTNAAQSVTASGAVAISGTASLTETAETLSASGALAIEGAATITESAETLTASGVVVSGIVGNASITEAEETITASGAIAIGGTASIAPTAQDVIATGSIAITGTANLYELAETLTASGIALGGITGSASLSQAAQTLSAFATAAFPTIARPTSDVSNAGWTASTGSDLYAMLDEVSPDDLDYISTSTLGAVCKMALNATQYPGSAAQQLSLRASSSTGNGLAVTIKDGATTIATRSLTLTPTYDLHTITLTSGEIAAITSGNLTVEMTSI
jgi:hypothetical protein